MTAKHELNRDDTNRHVGVLCRLKVLILMKFILLILSFIAYAFDIISKNFAWLEFNRFSSTSFTFRSRTYFKLNSVYTEHTGCNSFSLHINIQVFQHCFFKGLFFFVKSPLNICHSQLAIFMLGLFLDSTFCFVNLSFYQDALRSATLLVSLEIRWLGFSK